MRSEGDFAAFCVKRSEAKLMTKYVSHTRNAEMRPGPTDKLNC